MQCGRRSRPRREVDPLARTRVDPLGRAEVDQLARAGALVRESTRWIRLPELRVDLIPRAVTAVLAGREARRTCAPSVAR
jgi:hypothetical protein